VSEKTLRRYADLPGLLYMLNERMITLLDPGSWDDSNDSYYLRLYKEKKGLKCVLALCFTQAIETYHHWRVFANGSSGVCIQFRRSELLKAARQQSGTRAQTVTYLKLTDIKNKTVATEDLPFLKRRAFEDEDEFRVIYESATETKTTLDLPIPLSSVERITLSPWIPPALAEHVKRVLRSVDGCANLKVVRSTLIGNDQWKRAGDGAHDGGVRSTGTKTHTPR
jgi:Protein of unknown function (DUF2971)